MTKRWLTKKEFCPPKRKTKFVREREQRKRRDRSVPFRLLCLLLWGRFAFVTWQGFTFTVETPHLRRYFRLTTDKIHGYFDWLGEQGYLKDVQHTKGWVRATVVLPEQIKSVLDKFVERYKNAV